MPIYPLKCKCGHAFEAFAHHSQRADVECPACKSKDCEVDFTQMRFSTDRVFSGSEERSLMYGFHPSEVKDAQRLFSAGKIDSKTGDVLFSSRSEQRKFAKQFTAWRQKNDPAYAAAVDIARGRERAKEKSAQRQKRHGAARRK